MKIEKDILMKAEYLKNFDDTKLLKLPLDVELVLNSIRLYASCKWRNECGKWEYMTFESGFTIQKESDGVVIIPTLHKEGVYIESILLRAERVIKATVINIEASDYVDLTEKDGCYTFTLNEKVVI